MNRTLSVVFLTALALGSVPAVEARAEAVTGADPSAGFESLSRQAAAARDGNRSDEAMDLYGQALGLRPDWDEGWWYLGTLRYEAQRHVEAVEAFDRFVTLKPEIAAGWVLLGINERELPDYASAVEHIQRGLDLGLGGPLKEEAWYQISLALIKREHYERAVEPLSLLARVSPEPAVFQASRPAIRSCHSQAPRARVSGSKCRRNEYTKSCAVTSRPRPSGNAGSSVKYTPFFRRIVTTSPSLDTSGIDAARFGSKA